MGKGLPIDLPHDKIENFSKKWKITEISLFGSVLREDFEPGSDVDVLVSFSPTAKHTLFDLVRMQDELQEILGHNVDLVERKTIERSENYLRRRSILESIKVIYVEG